MLKMMIDALVIAIALKKEGCFNGCEVQLGDSGKVMKIPADITLEKLEGAKSYLEKQLEESDDPAPSSPAAAAHAK